MAFQAFQAILLAFVKSGTSVLLMVSNQGRHVVQLRKINVTYTWPGGMTHLSLRPPPDGISWSYPGTFMEPGQNATFYTFTGLPAGSTIEAMAEYIEIAGLSRSEPFKL